MKIKFIKDYRFIGNDPDDGSDTTVQAGNVVDLENTESAQWLVDNGFAEEVKESGWWRPKHKEEYYFISNVVEIIDESWLGAMVDEFRYSIGNCFGTKKAAERYLNYLKAIATVRQDKGVLTTQEANKQCANGNRVYCLMPPGTVRNTISLVAPGGIYFKDVESAGDSLDKHRNEWRTIINYDWSRE